LVDLVNNLQELAEDQHEILKNLTAKVKMMDKKNLNDQLGFMAT